MLHPRVQPGRGFTLIEMIVSLGVFSVVVTITTGALITLIAGNQRFQREQNTTTNLAFALDSMTREIRTGYNYYCISYTAAQMAGVTSIFQDGDAHENLRTALRDCPTGATSVNHYHGISFYEGGNSITGAGVNRIAYYYDPVQDTVFRRVGNNPPERIISQSVVVQSANIFVSQTAQLLSSTDANQPTVTIHMEARDRSDTSGKTYLMQTTVTQRSLDL